MDVFIENINKIPVPDDAPEWAYYVMLIFLVLIFLTWLALIIYYDN